MRKTVLLCTLLLSMLTLPALARAQDADKPSEPVTAVEPAKAAEPAPHFYHLVFVVQELDGAGKPVNSRSYTTSVSSDRGFRGSLRTGSRIPIATGSSSGVTTTAVVQFQYIDVGVNFDVSKVTEVNGKLALFLGIEISSIADPSEAHTHQPVIRQNRGAVQVLIPLGKPTVVFSSDSLDSKGSLQVTVTATPLG